MEPVSALPASLARAVTVDPFGPALAPLAWGVRQGARRRAHLMLLESGCGHAAWQGSAHALAGPSLLWLPGSLEGTVSAEAGARGTLVSVEDDLLIRVVAASADAANLRRASEQPALIEAARLRPVLPGLAESCRALAAELRSPSAGAATLVSSHLLLLVLALWRFAAAQDADVEAVRGGRALVGRFLQMIELHYRDNWPVARYAAALGVSADRLHAHCRREKDRSPRALIHERLLQEACLRLEQLDLPVEQIGYGLGFRDAAYFSRFFRRGRGVSPGDWRRRTRLEHARRQPSYAAWP
jgi:AraC family transcriptional activator of pobA